MSKRKSIITNNLAFAAIILAALIIRLLSSFAVFANGKVSFIGYDSFYHMRRIIDTTSNFPNYLTFDSYLNYPFGFEIGWPPLYDQAAAFLAMMLGLGNPDLYTIEVAGAILPPLLGVLTLIPLYAVASTIFEKRTALFSAAVLAVIPVHVAVSRAGAVDHHVAEILLSTTAFAFFMLSLKHAAGIDLLLSDIKRVSSKTVAKPLIYAACSGIVLALSVFTWLGSPIFVGLIGLYAIVQFTLDLKENRSSQYLIISGITTYLATLILVVPVCIASVRPGFEVSAGFLSWFHVFYVTFLLVAFVLLGALSHIVYLKDLKWWYYPASVTVLVVVGTTALSMFSSEFYHNVLSALGYLAGGGDILGTISEAQPLFHNPDGKFTLVPLWGSFTLLFLTAFAGFDFVTRKTIRENYTPETVFFIVWTVVVALLMLSQRRFMYLFSINVAILTGYFIMLFPGVSKLGIRDKATRARQKQKIWQVAAIVIVLGIILIPAVAQSVSVARYPSVVPSDWQESLMWLESNTPLTSYYSNPVEKPEYGVMSWWDYGNWIVYLAHRPVVANNFQAGVGDAARFFVTTDEGEANAILEKRNVRYVITDVHMVKTKFQSIAKLAGEDYLDYYTTQTRKVDSGTKTLMVENNKFKGTVLVKLHAIDGATLGNLRLVYESNTTKTENPEVKYVKIFEFVNGAKITGFAAPNQIVYAVTNVVSNRGRAFEYYNTAIANETGWYELTVSYSNAGAPYYTTAVTSYFVGTENSDVVVDISIKEDDVINGREIRVDLI